MELYFNQIIPKELELVDSVFHENINNHFYSYAKVQWLVKNQYFENALSLLYELAKYNDYYHEEGNNLIEILKVTTKINLTTTCFNGPNLSKEVYHKLSEFTYFSTRCHINYFCIQYKFEADFPSTIIVMLLFSPIYLQLRRYKEEKLVREYAAIKGYQMLYTSFLEIG